MADAVGLAIGLLSCGIQLYSAVDTLCRALKDRDLDASSLSSTSKLLQSHGQTVLDTLNRIPVEYNKHTESITYVLDNWHAEKGELDILLRKVTSCTESLNWTEKLKYAFREQKALSTFKARLEGHMRALLLALEVLGV